MLREKYIEGVKNSLFTFKLAKEYAPGIPTKETSHELPKIDNATKWEFGLHHHKALKRGEHYDLRLGDPSTGFAHSWAMKPEWPKPGESTWAIQQPTHTLPYMSFEGDIPKGTYGAGGVTLKDRDKIEVINSAPGHITFNIYKGYGPETYTLHRVDGKKWKLYNRTATRDTHTIPDIKPKYKEIDFTDVKTDNPKQVLSAKLDDAHVMYYLPKDSKEPIRVFSYRPSKRTEGLIQHTDKVTGLHAPYKTAPKEVADSIIRGGLYAIHPDTKKATPANVVGGLLNSNVWKSREAQKEQGKLLPVIYDVVKFKGKDVRNAPYKEKLDILRQVSKELPVLKLPIMAHTKTEKERLVQDIKNKRLPETEEGVVVWELEGENTPATKAKIVKEHDVYVRDFFPATEGSKYDKTHVGGFYFSHTENGPIVGRVGSGLSDALREDMFKNPKKYIGMVSVVEAQAKYPSGALRMPVHTTFHLDKNAQNKLDKVIMK